MKKDTVLRYWRERGGWATALYLRTCERGERFGLWECRTAEGKRIFVRPDEVKLWDEKGGDA